jgi:hypothetical protein
VRFRSPRRDDAPFVIVFIRVNHRDFLPVHQATRVDSAVPIVETVIHLLDCRTIEDTHRIFESDAVANKIATVLVLISL